jgi:hypothetical protein
MEKNVSAFFVIPAERPGPMSEMGIGLRRCDEAGGATTVTSAHAAVQDYGVRWYQPLDSLFRGNDETNSRDG